MNGNMPQWVKIVSTVGFPIAVSFYLGVMLYPITANVETKVIVNGVIAGQLVEQGKQQIKVLTQICRNVAKNEYEKSNCELK